MNLTGVVCRLILVLIMFNYVLAIVQSGYSYRNCFYKKRVYPTNYGGKTSLPQTIFIIILFFKIQCREHWFMKTCVKHPRKLAFFRKLKETGTERYSIKKSSERSCSAIWLFYNCRKCAYSLLPTFILK